MQTKKRKMKAGEALVGMKRIGSQLCTRVRVSCECGFDWVGVNKPAETEHAGGSE